MVNSDWAIQAVLLLLFSTSILEKPSGFFYIVFVTNLICKVYCKYLIYLFILPFYHCKFILISWQIFTYLPT